MSRAIRQFTCLALVFVFCASPAWAQSHKRKHRRTKKKPTITQTMTNSPSGIQAGGNVTVNQGIQPRKLTVEQETQFLKILKDSPKGNVYINCIESGGTEPCDFARQIARLMESKDAGWKVTFEPLMFGAGDPTKTIPEMYIQVHSNKNPPPRAIVLQYALKSVGYDAIGIERSDVAADFVQLTVWFRQPINQSMTNSPGGVQAGRDVIINQAPADRHLTAEQKDKLLEILRNNPKGKVGVTCHAIGGEPCNFAREIIDVLRSAGWVVEFNDHALIIGETQGLVIQIRSANSAPVRAVVLQQSLKTIGFAAVGQLDNSLNEDDVKLLVGTRP